MVQHNMIYREYAPLNFTKCHWEDLQCPPEIECEPESETDKNATFSFSPKGCRPYCGRCKTGYKCSAKGKCLKEEVMSQRQGSEKLLILLSIIIVLFIL